MAELVSADPVTSLRVLAEDYSTKDPSLIRRDLSRLSRERDEASRQESEHFAPPALRDALIPPRFRPVTFESYHPKTESQRMALAAAQEFVSRTIAGTAVMLALIGETGSGKSHLLYSVANALAEAGRQFYARPWYRLADELRYGGRSAFNSSYELEAPGVRQQLWGARIALIDEVRPTASTAFDDTELAKFACHAYDAMLSVIVTSNVNPLADVMGPAAASRFTQVVIQGPDYRQRS